MLRARSSGVRVKQDIQSSGPETGIRGAVDQFVVLAKLGTVTPSQRQEGRTPRRARSQRASV